MKDWRRCLLPTTLQGLSLSVRADLRDRCWRFDSDCPSDEDKLFALPSGQALSQRAERFGLRAGRLARPWHALARMAVASPCWAEPVDPTQRLYA